jgi:hypothetical protein
MVQYASQQVNRLITDRLPRSHGNRKATSDLTSLFQRLTRQLPRAMPVERGRRDDLQLPSDSACRCGADGSAAVEHHGHRGLHRSPGDLRRNRRPRVRHRAGFVTQLVGKCRNVTEVFAWSWSLGNVPGAFVPEPPRTRSESRMCLYLP